VRIAHRFIGGTRASNTVSPVGTAGREERVIRPYGTKRISAIIVPSTKDAGLLSEIPPGLGCLNSLSRTLKTARGPDKRDLSCVDEL
jgi:hypothetical protein